RAQNWFEALYGRASSKDRRAGARHVESRLDGRGETAHGIGYRFDLRKDAHHRLPHLGPRGTRGNVLEGCDFRNTKRDPPPRQTSDDVVSGRQEDPVAPSGPLGRDLRGGSGIPLGRLSRADSSPLPEAWPLGCLRNPPPI